MNTEIRKLETQLEDLMRMIEPTVFQGETDDKLSMTSPLEKLIKTKPIWFLPEITREESSKLLHNKKPGNFIIRGSRQPNTLAISVKIGTKQSEKVQHFIILKKDKKVYLEDSDIMFDNLVSLVFHYSHTCDELPEKLCLPAVLGAAESLQNLVSLSLLGKSFWTYPMARSDRTSFLVGPVHIQPEWYFLIAYAILRSIPNKLGGVVALALSIIILIICPFIYIRKFRGYIFYPLNKILFWVHINIWVLLTWLGARPVEDPYVFLGQVLSFIYFLYYFLRFFLQKIWDIILR